MKILESLVFGMLVLISSFAVSSPSYAASQTGIASVYGNGDGYAGRMTASGERMNPGAMTAAHRTLPFGTRVSVVNRQTGRQAIVRISDRGPFIRGRIIDLAPAGAVRLACLALRE